MNQVTTVDLVAEDYEEVELLDGRQRLLRVGSTNSLLPGIKTLMWVDAEGESLKSLTPIAPLIEQVTYRTTREEALAPANGGDVPDFGIQTLVKIAEPIPNPNNATEVVYRITVQDADPSKLFASGPSQTTTKAGPNTIELTVKKLDPESAPESATSDVAAEYREPNVFIESDDPKVVELAQQAADDSGDSWVTARQLEKWVYQNLADKNFTTTFASAAEVARNLEGDCTEHAVLLAALARARGIPSRVAIGLVYMQRSQTFGYHMWTEVFVHGGWYAVDGTLGRGGIGALHIKMADSSLGGVSIVETFLPVFQVLGKTSIEVVSTR
jgi:transglutaminase-like putative cysteine protease